MPKFLIVLANHGALFPQKVNINESYVLQHSNVQVNKGLIHIRSDLEEIDRHIEYWKYSLVGYFFGSKASLPFYKNDGSWNLKGAFDLLTLLAGFLLFRFELEEDKLS